MNSFPFAIVINLVTCSEFELLFRAYTFEAYTKWTDYNICSVNTLQVKSVIKLREYG